MYVYDHNGRDLTVWPFVPNWSEPFIESLDYLTDVIPAFNGSEQRIELRTNPRRIFEFNITVKGLASSLLSNILWSSQNRPLALPLWHEKSTLSDNATSGTNVLTLDTDDLSLVEGGLVIVFNGADSFEVGEVDSFDSGSIILVDNLVNTWTTGTTVYPVLAAYMPQSISRRMLTNAVGEFVVQFNAEADSATNIPVGTDWSNLSFNSRYVLTKQPNWAQLIDLESQFDRDEIDYLVGRFTVLPTRTFPAVTKKYQWVGKNKSEIVALRKMFGTLSGRLKSCYVPSWTEDFVLNTSASSSATSIVVKSNGFHELIGTDDVLNSIVIFLRNGSYICKQITGTTQGVGTITLSFGSSLGTAINATNVKMISLIHLSRLLSDRITFNYLSDSVATVDASFITVKS